jgi:hypothetical protein
MLDAPRSEVQKFAKNVTLVTVHFHAQQYLYPNLSPNLPHLYQTKNNLISQRIRHFRLQCVKLGDILVCEQILHPLLT